MNDDNNNNNNNNCPRLDSHIIDISLDQNQDIEINENDEFEANQHNNETFCIDIHSDQFMNTVFDFDFDFDSHIDMDDDYVPMTIDELRIDINDDDYKRQ